MMFCEKIILYNHILKFVEYDKYIRLFLQKYSYTDKHIYVENIYKKYIPHDERNIFMYINMGNVSIHEYTNTYDILIYGCDNSHMSDNIYTSIPYIPIENLHIFHLFISKNKKHIIPYIEYYNNLDNNLFMAKIKNGYYNHNKKYIISDMFSHIGKIYHIYFNTGNNNLQICHKPQQSHDTLHDYYFVMKKMCINTATKKAIRDFQNNTCVTYINFISDELLNHIYEHIDKYNLLPDNMLYLSDNWNYTQYINATKCARLIYATRQDIFYINNMHCEYVITDYDNTDLITDIKTSFPEIKMVLFFSNDILERYKYITYISDNNIQYYKTYDIVSNNMLYYMSKCSKTYNYTYNKFCEFKDFMLYVPDILYHIIRRNMI